MSSWKTLKIRDIGTIVSGATPKTTEPSNWGGDIAWLTPADLSGYQHKYISKGSRTITQTGYDSCSTRMLPPGSVLFSSRAPIGYIAITTKPLCTNQGFKSVVPHESILADFLYYQLMHLKPQIAELGSGTTFKEISATTLGEVSINVPPLEEQERIVAKIEELFSELDNSVAALKQTKAQLSVYRQAVYAAAFNINNRLIPITHAFDISSGLTKNSKRNDFPQKFPYLRVANVYYNKLDLKEIKHIGATEAEIQKTLLKVDDLLFVEGNGSKSQIGRVALWDGSIPVCLHQNHIIKARAKGSTLPLFALYYMMSTHGRKQILDVASSTSGLYTLSANKIKNLSIPDCSIDEQEQIIFDIEGQLSACEDIEATITKTLQQTESLRQSILKQAFEGKLV